MNREWNLKVEDVEIRGGKFSGSVVAGCIWNGGGDGVVWLRGELIMVTLEHRFLQRLSWTVS